MSNQISIPRCVYYTGKHPNRQAFLVHFDMKSGTQGERLVDYSYIFAKMYEFDEKNAGDPKVSRVTLRSGAVRYFRKLSFRATERLNTRCPGAASLLSRQK